MVESYTPATVGTGAFWRTNKSLTAYIPERSKALYQTDNGWSSLILKTLSFFESPTGPGMRIKVKMKDGSVYEFKTSEVESAHITFSDDGEQMSFTVNGATVTYNLDNVSGMSHFNGTPSVSLHANQDPDANSPNFYTTFYSGLEAYTLPEGVKAYTAEVDGETIVLKCIEDDVLPQGEAVLLYSNELQDGNWTMETADPSATTKSTSNQFEGVDVATEQDAASYYMLSYGQQKLGFYKMNSSTLLAANKAFIVQSTAAPAKAMRMVFAEDVDGFERISNDSANSPTGIYTVGGIHLSKLQKGINIVNGKKVIVK